MGVATFLSRILGLVREQVYAHFMGDTPVASAFKLAFQIPNLFRRLLGEGALTAAFVPIFKEKEQTEGEEGMWHSANAVMAALILACSVVVFLAIVGITVILTVTSLKFHQGQSVVNPPFPIPFLSPETRLMLQLLRMMFPYLILVCMAALCMGMLNARGQFFVPALGASLLNVVMIASVLWLAPRFGVTMETQIFALAVGVLLAGTVQFGFQIPALRKLGFRFRWVSPWKDETVRIVIRRMAPAALGVAAFQLNVLIIQSVGYAIDKSIVASFDYAVRLMEFPQGIVGVSLSTYLLSSLSGMAAEKNYDGFRSNLRQGLGYLVFINVVAGVLLFVLAVPIVRLLFERGAFTPASTARAAAAVAALAPGLVCFSLVNTLARAFFALGDTQTPMKISLACLALNLLVAMWLIGPFRQAGLGMANTASSCLNTLLLCYALKRKLPKFEFKALLPVAVSSAGAGVVAGVVAWLMAGWLDARMGHAGLGSRATIVFVPLLSGGLIYLGMAMWLRIPQAREMLDLVLGRFRRKKA